ncbi:MAG: DUF362 domain-containing protein [Deltaproteobacteria bacterium]|nr:DUF362 domain-containing protein [Deltaproteobacteria bacterium]
MPKEKSNRRNFLKKTALASAAITFGSRLQAFAGGQKVKLVKVSGEGVVKDMVGAVAKALQPLGGMKAFVKKGQSVLIKPNMGFPTPPELHATTSPDLIAAVAKQALDCGASKVLIVDNPIRRPEACIRVVGIKEATKDLDVHVLMPTSEKMYTMTPIPKGKSLKKTKILKDALKCDVHIALPIGKSHNAAGFSGTLKGMMGLILDRESFHSRYDLNQAVADLNTVLKPDLTILDGIKVMTTDGPAGPGELTTCNTIIAGTDPVAVDAAAVELAPLYGRKIKPRQIKHLKAAQQMGLGKLSLAEDQIVIVKM